MPSRKTSTLEFPRVPGSHIAITDGIALFWTARPNVAHAPHLVKIMWPLEGVVLLDLPTEGARLQFDRPMVLQADVVQQVVASGPRVTLYLDPETAGWPIASSLRRLGAAFMPLPPRLEKKCQELLQLTLWGPQLFAALASLSTIIRQAPEWGQPAPAPPWLIRSAARIEAASSNGFDRAVLAQAENMNERRLSAEFKTQTGLTLRRYGQWIKMAHAIQFASRGASFTDAGIQAGFADAPHFTRSLKSLLGSVPSVVPFERSLIEGDFFNGLRRAAAAPDCEEAA